MPKQDHDRFQLNREAVSQYRGASIPEKHHNEVEGLRRSLGRFVLLKPTGEIFKVPTCRIIAQAYIRSGDMATLRQVVMETSNYLDDNPYEKPADTLSVFAFAKMKSKGVRSPVKSGDVESKWVKELDYSQDQ